MAVSAAKVASSEPSAANSILVGKILILCSFEPASLGRPTCQAESSKDVYRKPSFRENSSRKPAEQARCATLHSATGCGRAHRCDESRSLFANYKGMRCHVPQTLPLGRSHNRDEAYQVTEKPINDAQYRS